MSAYKLEDLAQALFEESGDALFLFDPDTDQLLDANSVAQRLSGFPLRELLRMPVTHWFQFEGVEGPQSLRQAGQKTGVFHSREGFLLRTAKEGVWVPVNVTVARLHVKPKTIGLITARDIRKQREAHVQLQAVEAELRRVLASVSDCLWSADIDPEGQFAYRYISPVIEKIASQPADFFLPGVHRWWGIVHPEDQGRWAQGFARLRAAQPSQEEYRILWPDGSLRWVRDSVMVSRLADDRLRLDGVLTDITERRRAEEALRESERMVRALFDIAGMMRGAVEMVDDDLLHISANQAAAQSLGIAPEALQNRLASQCGFPAGPWRQWLDRYREAQRTGRPVHFDYTHETPAGRKWLSATVCLLGQGPENRPRFAYVVQDVTDQKQAEAAQRQAEERLENRVRQAQKLQFIGKLAGWVARDFNNLLTAILACRDLILDRLSPEDPLRQHLDEVLRNADTAVSFTRRLLGLGRKDTHLPQVLDLNALVAGMDKILQRLIDDGIELTLLLAAPSGRVKADRGQIEHMLLALALNAAAGLMARGRLTIETAVVELKQPVAGIQGPISPGSYVRLAIRGGAAGSAPTALEPLLSNQEDQDSGLSLAAVYGIIKQNGGHVVVSAEPDQGAAFEIYLPRVEEPATVVMSAEDTLIDVPQAAQTLPLSQSDVRAKPEVRPTPGSSLETILLVEDEELVRALVRDILSKNGYRVLEARHGLEARALCEQHQGTIHLLLTDVILPQMNGLELYQRLLLLRPDMKVLFVSGATDSPIVTQGLSEEKMAFLQKPFSPEALVQRVRELVEQQLSPSAGGGEAPSAQPDPMSGGRKP